MTHRTITTRIITLLLAGVMALAPHSVSAQTPALPGQALEINPPVINTKANPGETIKTQISIRGLSTSKLLVSNDINDFTAAGEDGSPKIMLEPGESNPYSMKSWISPLPKITLNPKQISDLTVNIAVPANAAPGGYFAVIRFTATAPELKDTGVALSASIGTLVLLRVNGDAKESVDVEEFFTSVSGNKGSLYEGAPIQFVERIKNAGSVHEQPRGQITIKDMFGQKVANLNVNLENRNVLPGSIRRFEQPLDNSVIGNKILFGRYTADLVMTYGSTGQQATASLSFWVIPYRLIGGVIAIMLVLFFLIRFAIRRYNNYIIGQTRGRRRR
jgi:hypothetical protein